MEEKPELKALQSLLLKQKVRSSVSEPSVCSFPRVHQRIRLGFWLPPTSPLRSRSHLLSHYIIFLLPPSSFFSPPTHTINPHHSTICFLHSLALTVGSLISIQSSRQITLVTHSAPTPLPGPESPASNQPYSSGFVQVCLPDPSCLQLSRKNTTLATLIYSSPLITWLTLTCTDFPSLQRTQHSTYLIPTASINGKPTFP